MGPITILMVYSLGSLGALLAATAFVACRAVASGRTLNAEIRQHRIPLRLDLSRSIAPATLIAVQSHLKGLAEEFETAVPRELRLIDRWIDESDRRIAQLQHRLATGADLRLADGRRAPDVIRQDDFEHDRAGVHPARPQAGSQPARRAA